MTHSIARLCSALCLAICCSFSNAQTLNADGTTSTNNLIDNSQWTGIGAYAPNPNDCCTNPAGSQPLYDTTDNTIKFSYGQATVGQIIGINSALGSSGLQVNGYTWSYDAKTTSQNGTDPLTSYSFLTDGNGAVLLSNTYQHGSHDWQTFSGTQTLNNPYDITGGGTVGIQFSGTDSGFWAGLYGPQVKNVSLKLNYSAGIDPCITDPLSSTSCPGYAVAYKDLQCSINPLYDTTCPGYAQAYYDQQCSFNPLYDAACPGRSAVVTSGNLVPNPGGGSGWFGGSINNSFAINTALSHAGSGVMIHGFNWGYRALNFNVFGFGLGSSTVNVNIRDGDGTSLHAWSRNNTSSGENWYSSSYVFPQSRNNITLGNFDFTATSSGWGYVDNMWARAIFTPDSCSLDPLSSVLCTGYEAAFLTQQCSMNTLYSPSCPGYAEALAEMLANSVPSIASTDTTADPTVTNTGASAGSSTSALASSPTTDPTKTDATVTTDVGGVEMTTTGEIVVADSVPATVKEAAKESTKSPDSAATETKTTSTTTTEKKTTKVNAVALAMAAVRETESTARSAAEAAVAQSQSSSANPTDGTGATVNLGGITLSQLRAASQAGQDSTTTTAVNRAAQQAVTSSRALSADTETMSSDDNRSDRFSVSGDSLQDTVKQTTSTNYNLLPQDVVEEKTQDRKSVGTGLAMPNMSVLPTVPEEPKTVTGPSVRRGGAVDGMSGGDMNALASVPANFNDYLGKQIQDSSFYASKEIYKGQRNVDNARALRGLGTDRLHQQMIDQQYGK